MKFDNTEPGYYNQPGIGDQVTVIIDETTGQLGQLKTIAELADGSQRRLEFMRLKVVNQDKPPSNVLQILKNARLP